MSRMIQKIRKEYKRILKALFMILPLFLGVYGYYVLEHFRLADALFHAIGLYAMADLDTPPNIFVEAARWTAPLVTASGLVWLIEALRERCRNWFCYIRGNSVFVYGEGADAQTLLEELGRRGIRGKDRFVRAERYVLLKSEEENFAFYRKNQEKLRKTKVCMKCSSLRYQKEETNLKFFSEEETAARLYWKQADLYGQAKEKNFRLKIAIVGFEKLEQELLVWGLQDNIFSPDQRLEYHVFGDGSRFRALYHELGQIQDPVIFYSDPWYENLDVLRTADRIIVQDKGEVKDLLFALPGKEFEVFEEEEESVRRLETRERVRFFFWKKEAQRLDRIFEDRLLENAKRLNLRYAHIYGGLRENEENKEAEWGRLDSFTRYSNISAADYHEIRCEMIADRRRERGERGVDPAYKEMLAELEHIRWCRYHYLNNWKYGVPESGKSKDRKQQIHRDLVAYEALSEAEKEKDRENVRILMELL